MIWLRGAAAVLKRLHLWVLAAACALASLLVIPGAVASSAGRASAPPTPRFDGGVHLGVTSCAGPCHGRQSASGLIEGAAVRGSELAAWQDPFSPRGAHARAYASLRTPLGRAIGANLGMADPALEPACLSCHADAAQARGPAFQISDGVGCEACHGGAGERWIASHYGGEASYPANVADGLYPTADLQSRARLCLSCHLGAAAQDQFVSHRIMVAGHPRISFELELFTALQAHHVEDERYFADKPQETRAKAWAIGQAVAAAQTLELFLQRAQGESVFPELVFYDCRSCHRPIEDHPDAQSRPLWTPNPGRPNGPGTVAFNDAHLIILSAAAAAFAPPHAAELRQKTYALHRAVLESREQAQAAARALLAAVREATLALESGDYRRETVERALREVLGDALAPRYTAYAAAEQAVMAADSLHRTLVDLGGLSQARSQALAPHVAAAYAAVEDPNRYNQAEFRARLSRLGRELGVL